MARDTFELLPLSPFRLDLTVWILRRRAGNLVDRWDGKTYRRVLPLPRGPVELAVTQPGSPDAARLRVTVTGLPLSAALKDAVTSVLGRLLGLNADLTEFYRCAAHDRRLGTLARRFRGMKPPRFTTLFECLVNAMACQQVTLTLGVQLLNRLAVAYGAPFDNGCDVVYAFPLPADLAKLSPTDLRQLGFSRQKGQSIIALAQQSEEARLDRETLEALPDGEIVSRLIELRGVGRWTAEYALLRGLGRTHVFPGDDVGARNNLQRWLGRARPLDYPGVRRALTPWSEFAGLVYFHLLLDRLAEAGHLVESGASKTFTGDRS